MRAVLVLLTCLASLPLPLLAQDSDYPTLAALANADVPAYLYADTAWRFEGVRARHKPPDSPPQYAVGDRDSLTVPSGANWSERRIVVELRGMTDNVLIWVKEGVEYSNWRAQALAQRVEARILPPLQALFNYVEPPGVDGDPRLTVVLVYDPPWPSSGIFTRGHTLPRALNPGSNQREMMVVNLAYGDGSTVDDDYVISVISHEYQHMLLHHRDFGEEHWLNEALSGFASNYVGSPEIVRWTAEEFLKAPHTSLTQLRTGEDLAAKYGAGTLFLVYLASRFGDEIIARLHEEPKDGWYAVDAVLREQYRLSADEVFADWALANYYQAEHTVFGYADKEMLPTIPQPVANLRSFPARHRGSLRQYSTDYIAVDARGADTLALQLVQPPEARLIETAAPQGEHFYYALPKETSSRRLTRRFDIRARRPIWLTFRIWYDLQDHYEYGYVQVSIDGGYSWQVLPGDHTTNQSRYGRFYANGWTGSSGGWLQERIDLSDYGSRSILLRFEVLTDSGTHYRGLAIDDLRIDAIGFHDGFEQADAGWNEEGWIRTDNRLPQNAWLQVAQDTPDDGLHVARLLLTGTESWSFELHPGVDTALVAVSSAVPQTALMTDYELVVNLLDADGNVITLSRDCTVTTTTGLNFRDAPGGSKIGLIPQGTAVDALDRRGDWLQVDYDGALGWVHGGYVTGRGDCP